ncbi:hypothetical protein BGY98DRAFT_1094399 [Russula aff. rugulosa BPL654]|nr:hypothetical protein BGY98DRAFT_1094399 [Russula aff. rugulosa BPL654]
MLGLGVLSLRYVARSLAISRTLRHQQYQPTHRRDALRTTFSTTPSRLASEVPDDFIDAIKHTELFKKIADRPKALKASRTCIDVNSMTPPSEIRMFQLVTNLKLMRTVKRVMDELKAAGFKMNSDDALQEIINLAGELPKKKIEKPNGEDS